MWAAIVCFSVGYMIPGTAADHVTGMTISPTEAARSPGSNLTVMCTSDKPIEGCNFRVWFAETGGAFKLNRDYPVMDFSRGTNATGVMEKKYDSGTDLYHARYSGKGLDDRECGIEFTPKSQGRYLVACRGRAENEDWGYEFMSLYVKYEQQPVQRDDVREDSTTVTPSNREVYFLHNTKQHHVLKSCTFFFPRDPTVVLVDRTNSNPNLQGRYEAKLNDHICSFTLSNLTERDNGVWWYSVTAIRDNSSENYDSLLYKFVILPKAPSNDSVSLRRESHEAPFSAGDELTATCRVNNSRPVGDISWLLGGEDISSDVVSEDKEDGAWHWPWDDRSIKQTLKRTLKSGDNGKNLTCQVKHEELQEDLVDTLYLDVQGGADSTVSTGDLGVIVMCASLAWAAAVN